MAHNMQIFEHSVCEQNVSLHTVMVRGAPWFRGGADVANALNYANPYQAVRKHVDEEDRVQLKDLDQLSESGPLKHNDGLQIFISESGLYLLTLWSVWWCVCGRSGSVFA